MLDELELAFDEQDRERGRHRHRRSAARRGGKGPAGSPKRRGRSFFALFMTVVLLGALGAGAWYGYDKVKDFFTAPDYTSATGNGTEARVTVRTGQTATEIGQDLVKADVVKSVKAYTDAVKSDPHGNEVQPGTYKLFKQMRARDALAALLAVDDKGGLRNKVSFKVTVPEGSMAVDIFSQLSKTTNIPVANFQEAAKDPVALGVPDWWFNRTDGRPTSKSVEGFLFPATYEFNPDADAKTILSTMVGKFNTVVGDLKFAEKVQAERQISPYEALIVATIAQAETPLPEDMSKVARVMYNRAFSGNFPCQCLQVDVTVNYWLRLQGKDAQASKNLTQSQLHNTDNPYNTHDKPGLPLGPINNPGKEALAGAMSPAEGGIVFFVTIDKQGHTAFATTNAEHDRNVELARKNGVL
jgi:UPF0755 protein